MRHFFYTYLSNMSEKSKRKSVSFKAQARTIDHLGKGQIADAPTAVSELWKNSYDAYARDVALHLFDGETKCGAIIDNGCGMTFEQLSDSWLTVGTASKSQKKLLPIEDRFGLRDRSTQGEKGIGRLSTAFLAPVTLVVTKKSRTQFSAALIDWRLFENTYLSLHDIQVPMQEFEDLSNLPQICTQLQGEMLKNLALSPETEDEKILRQMWARFTNDEREAFNLRHSKNNGEVFKSTEECVKQLCDEFSFKADYVNGWKSFLEKVKCDGGTHGTALFLIDLNRDLEMLTNRGSLNREASEYQDIKTDLVDTLRAFVDPFARRTPDIDESTGDSETTVNELNNVDFRYEILAFGSGAEEPDGILDYDDVFKYAEFEGLEHKIEGVIDEKGWFRGDITAFGKEHPDVVIPCRAVGMEEHTKAGRFHLKLGTFEQEFQKTTHTKDEHDFFVKQAKKYSGFMIFRDGLRVLPYGRTDNDFFQIEERRAKNAGAHYWSSRRLFGQILLDQTNNQRLKDKAGREGFVKNQAARELKSIVKILLEKLANNYFGSKSDERKIMLEQLAKDKRKQAKARSSSSRVTKKAFTEAMGSKLPKLNIQVQSAREIFEELEEGISISINRADDLISRVNNLESLRPELKVPNKPSKLSETLEEQYRGYRDLFGELSELLLHCREHLNKLEALNKNRSPIESAQSKYDVIESAIFKQLNRYNGLIEKSLDRLHITWKNEVKIDKELYQKAAIPILDSVTNNSNIEYELNELDKIYREHADDIAYKYEAFLQALDKLEQGVDLESAFTLAEEERIDAEKEINQIRGLAQLGISLEILAHELNDQDKAVSRALNSMTSSAKKEIGYKNAVKAHRQFTDYLRFLSPLKLSGYQPKDNISGGEIIKDVSVFFGEQFDKQNIKLEFSDSFKRMNIVDVKSRIIPVFVNLLNNAMYWVGLAENERLIKVDIINDLVVIANNGPAVDEDDINKLFQLFYSCRPSGNGVGLYLSRQNLAVSRHKIWYAEVPEEKLILNGANFVIQFRGMEVKAC